MVTSITFSGGAGYTYAPTVSIAMPPPSGNVTTDVNGHFSIPIKAGYFKTDGTETIGIRATDAAGETGNMQLLNFVLDTQAPAGPSTVLDPGSDNGTFNNDNITSDNNSTTKPSNAPVFDVGTATNPVPVGATVQLFRTPVNADGSPITVQTAMATATISGGMVTAIGISVGGSGYASAPGVTITGGGGSGATATATLTNGVVTGVTITSAGSGYTSAPTITITPSVLVNTLTSTAGGVVQIADINQSTPALLQTPGTVIPDGTYVYSAVVTDLAGNVSQPGPSSPVITIDTVILVAPPPTVAPGSDSGLPVALRSSDAITNIALPTFQGTVGPNAVVSLLVGVGTNLKAAGTTTANAAGLYAITTTVPLVSGLNNVEIVETDQAGNVTLPSTPLAVRLDTAPVPSLAAPTLAPFSDTGTFSNDTLTDTTTPTFMGTATPWQFFERQPDAADRWDTGPDLPSARDAAARHGPGTGAAAGESRLPGGRGAGQSDQRRVLRDGRPVRQPAARGRRGRDSHGDGRRRCSHCVYGGGRGLRLYRARPAVTLIGGGGSGTGFVSATAIAVLNGDGNHPGQVTSIQITGPGSGYLTARRS